MSANSSHPGAASGYALTRKEQLNEMVKCGKNPLYFIKKYCYIQHPLRGLIKFDTYPFQDDCIKAYQEHRLNIVLKSRQLGLSTISAAYATWLAIFYKDKNILIIATKLTTAINFVKKVKVVLKNLPPWLLVPKYEPTKQMISFNNGSQILAVPTSEDAGRSEALSLLICDEAAWIRTFEEIWTGLSPTISTGGRAIILSTPNGVGGQYYQLWTDAVAGQNDFNPINLPWHVHPEHDDAWYKKETRSLSAKRVAQEFDCSFASSGDTFLQAEVLETLRSKIVEPMRKAGFDRNVWIWNEPIAGHSYVLSADVARGDAHDYSTFHVIDTETYDVSAEYMGKLPPEKFADLLAEWGTLYNKALIIPENNTFGYFVVTKLRDVICYECLYYDKNMGDPFHYVPMDKSELPGFPTNVKTRVQILTKIEALIRNEILHSHSRRLYDQLQAFVWNGNKPQAGKDSHDDLIMSLAIGCWLLHGVESVSNQAAAMAYAMLAATHVSSKDMSSLPGGIDEAQPLVDPNLKGMNANSVFRPRDPSSMAPRNPMMREVVNYDWLLR